MNIRVFFSLLYELSRLRRRERWSRQQLEAHQARSLRLLREYAYAHSPFYRQFHQGLFDRPLQELPVLTKADMMEHFDELVTDRAIRLTDVEQHMLTLQGDERFLGRYRVNSTSGSTGRRGLFLFDHAEWVTVLASFIRAHEWQEGAQYFPPRMRLAAVVSPTPWHMSRRGSATLYSTWTPTLRLSASDPVESMVGRLNDFQPELMGAYPSVMRALASEQLAGRLHISPRYVYTGAEVLTPETRRRIEEAWGKNKLFDIYGATETGSLAAECVHHTGLHLFEDQVIVEVVDLDNRPAPPGVSGDKLLITVLFNRTQPLIRYEISDSVQIAEKQGCPCGRPFTLISGIQGRMEDILHFPAEAGGEAAIDPTVFDQVMDRVPAGEWQVVQEADGLDILLSGAPKDFSDETLAQDLRVALAAHNARVPAVRVLRVPAIPRSATGKAPLIKSNLPRRPS
jgi:phenylacetate-coenzyme A ligase PaaK-like adenylate-forming protein